MDLQRQLSRRRAHGVAAALAIVFAASAPLPGAGRPSTANARSALPPAAQDVKAPPACDVGTYRLVPLPLVPVSINARGEVLGELPTHRAAIWSPTQLRELALPEGFTASQAVSMNDRGVAVAVAQDLASGRTLAYAVRGTQLVRLAGDAARPFRIDATDTVAGEAVTAGQSRSQPVLWSLGSDAQASPQRLDSCCGGTAKVLDGHGGMAGDLYDESGRYHAARWRLETGFLRLDGSARFSSALAMNTRGEVLLVEFPRLFLATPAGLTPIVIAGKRALHPHALNGCDVMVGEMGPFADAARAFVWSRAQGMRDLNTLVTGDSGGLILKSALDIDEAGDIVGRAATARDMEVGFLLRPAPRD